MRLHIAIVSFFLFTDVTTAHAFGRRAPQFKAEVVTVELASGKTPIPCKEVRKRKNEAEDLASRIGVVTDSIVEEIAYRDSREDYRALLTDIDELASLRSRFEKIYPAAWNEHDRGQAMTWVIPLPDLLKKLSDEEETPRGWKISGASLDRVLLNRVPAYSQIQLKALFNESQAVIRGYWPLSPVNACLTKLSLRISAKIELKDAKGSGRRVEVRLTK